MNGADGIGTGWSTSIPNYNPLDIIVNLRRRISNPSAPFLPMKPWFRGFKGLIGKHDEKAEEIAKCKKWTMKGILDQEDEATIHVSELPIRKWSSDYKDLLEEMLQNGE